MHNNRTGASTLENRDFVGESGLIVGGTSGIGKAVARLLLERGAASVIVAGRNVEKLHAAESELSAFGRVGPDGLARRYRQCGRLWASSDAAWIKGHSRISWLPIMQNKSAITA
jgi:NAD(P)-dependent dehydrogenase (short-subunit alcohol dehydrogenase family)